MFLFINSKIFCFRTSFPVLERPFPVLEHPFLFFGSFGKVVLSQDVPGQNKFQEFKKMTRFPVFGHHFPVLEHHFPVLEHPFPVLEQRFLF